MGAFKVWKKDEKGVLFFLIKILKEDKSTKHQKIIGLRTDIKIELLFSRPFCI